MDEGGMDILQNHTIQSAATTTYQMPRPTTVKLKI